jgi:hypothetical protein
VKSTHRAVSPNETTLPSDSLYIYDELPSTLNETLLSEPRKPEPLENFKADMEMKAHTSALTRKARLDKMQKNEKRFWVNPQFGPLKGKVQRNATKSDEDRSLMFDIILEDVYNKIQHNSIDEEDLPKRTFAEIEAACKIMYEQQRVLISAADDEQLVEK